MPHQTGLRHRRENPMKGVSALIENLPLYPVHLEVAVLPDAEKQAIQRPEVGQKEHINKY